MDADRRRSQPGSLNRACREVGGINGAGPRARLTTGSRHSGSRSGRGRCSPRSTGYALRPSRGRCVAYQSWGSPFGVWGEPSPCAWFTRRPPPSPVGLRPPCDPLGNNHLRSRGRVVPTKRKTPPCGGVCSFGCGGPQLRHVRSCRDHAAAEVSRHGCSHRTRHRRGPYSYSTMSAIAAAISASRSASRTPIRSLNRSSETQRI
jgi:hypothetical protein